MSILTPKLMLAHFASVCPQSAHLSFPGVEHNCRTNCIVSAALLLARDLVVVWDETDPLDFTSEFDPASGWA